jgi:hypothetical protein
VNLAAHHREEPFAYDVFVSHSAKDNAVVRTLAERLRKAGLNPNADGRMANAEILNSSFIIRPSLCAFGSDWAQLEAGTFRFRAPLCKECRFVPPECVGHD